MMRFVNMLRSGIGLLVFVILTVTLVVTALVLVNTAEAEKGPRIESGVSSTDVKISASKAGMEMAIQTATGPANGTAIVEVVSEPPICNGGRVRFTGVPSGTVTLGGCEPGEPIPIRRLSSPNLAPGTKVSTLAFIDQSIRDMGYRLAAIRCDDNQSGNASSGDLSTRKATFRTEANETVTCKFILAISTACVCPKEGRWKVQNHLGEMACTGVFSMTTPLKPVTTSGTLEIQEDDCSVILAEGMSNDEASITFRRTPQCGYRGTVGGNQGGIPMTINFTVDVVNDERLTGLLTSTVSRQGMTCNMKRTYELDYTGGP